MTAEPIRTSEVRTGTTYEQLRGPTRRDLAATQADRRVRLGDDVTLVFDGRDTVVASLEEALRTDRITDAAAVEATAEAFNALLAPPGALSATLYVDVADPAVLADRVAALDGVERLVSLDVNGARVPARTARRSDLGTGAVRLVFELDDDVRRSWHGEGHVVVVVDHPALQVRVLLPPAMRTVIGSDLPIA